jgi:purine-binding chemotaxis protein CheW
MTTNKGNTKTSFVSCRVGGSLIGIELSRVQEINRMVEATFVPRLPPEVQSRDQIAAQVDQAGDLGRRLGAHESGARRARNIIVHHHGERFGLLVDSVGDIVSAEAPLEPLPSHMAARQAQWFRGLVQLADDVLLILDVDAVIAAPARVAEPSR